jgi:hypothetical protein
VVVRVSYCIYAATTRRLNKNGVYCASSGEGYCDNDIVLFSAGKLVRYLGTVADGSACPSYPVKYDATNRRLVRSSEAYTCFGYVL